METGDRKLNEVKKVTDMAYVPVIMADGSIGQIAKSDLASVVAEMMSTNKIAPFGFYNNGKTTDNANNLNKLGIYRIVSLENYQELNYPANNGYIVNQFVSGSGYQLFFYADITTVYYRHKWNRWSDWIRIDNFGYNSLAELAGGVEGLVFPNFKAKAISSTNTSLKDIVEKDILTAYPSILGFVCGIISNVSGTHNYWGHFYKSGSYYYGTINIQLLGEKTIHTLTINKSVATE